MSVTDTEKHAGVKGQPVVKSAARVTGTENAAVAKVISRNATDEAARASLVKNRNDRQRFLRLLGPAKEEARRALAHASEVVKRQREAGEFSDPHEGFWRVIGEASKTKPPEEKEAARLVEEARKTASVCGRCGRDIQDGETVYWGVDTYVGMALVFGIGPKYVKTVTCEGCAPEYMVREAKGDPDRLPNGHVCYLSRFLERTCATCERSVVIKKSGRDARRQALPVPGKPGWYQAAAFCCERCRWTFYNAARNERNAQAREKVCEACGEPFTATRRDAKTCSASCRQKAYRQRKNGGAAS